MLWPPRPNRRQALTPCPQVAAASLQAGIGAHLQQLLALDWVLSCRTHVTALLAHVTALRRSLPASSAAGSKRTSPTGLLAASTTAGAAAALALLQPTGKPPVAPALASATGGRLSQRASGSGVTAAAAAAALAAAPAADAGAAARAVPGPLAAELAAAEELLLQWTSAMLLATKIHSDAELQGAVLAAMGAVQGPEVSPNGRP